MSGTADVIRDGELTKASYLAEVTNNMQLLVREVGAVPILKTHDWGYTWSNWNCQWNPPQPNPWQITTCASDFHGATGHLTSQYGFAEPLLG